MIYLLLIWSQLESNEHKKTSYHDQLKVGFHLKLAGAIFETRYVICVPNFVYTFVAFVVSWNVGKLAEILIETELQIPILKRFTKAWKLSRFKETEKFLNVFRFSDSRQKCIPTFKSLLKSSRRAAVFCQIQHNLRKLDQIRKYKIDGNSEN